MLPGKEEQEGPCARGGEGKEDDLSLEVVKEATRHAHQDQHARYVEDRLGGGAHLLHTAQRVKKIGDTKHEFNFFIPHWHCYPTSAA